MTFFLTFLPDTLETEISSPEDSELGGFHRYVGANKRSGHDVTEPHSDTRATYTGNQKSQNQWREGARVKKIRVEQAE